MIWESHCWKKALLKDREYLARFRISDATREDTLAGIEKRIFVSFYAIRKLMDAEKLSTSNVHSQWPIIWYPNLSQIDILNWDKIAEKYDLDSGHREARKLRWLCNQVIHSFVFIIDFAENGMIGGIFISSDREKNKRVFHVERRTLMDVLKLIGNDYPAFGYVERDKDGQLKTIQW